MVVSVYGGICGVRYNHIIAQWTLTGCTLCDTIFINSKNVSDHVQVMHNCACFNDSIMHNQVDTFPIFEIIILK
jgi:hypothetical protein